MHLAQRQRAVCMEKPSAANEESPTPLFLTRREARAKPVPLREAEREGFEPSTHLSAGTRFPVAFLRPLGHLSGLAESSARQARSQRPKPDCAGFRPRPRSTPTTALSTYPWQ